MLTQINFTVLAIQLQNLHVNISKKNIKKKLLLKKNKKTKKIETHDIDNAINMALKESQKMLLQQNKKEIQDKIKKDLERDFLKIYYQEKKCRDNFRKAPKHVVSDLKTDHKKELLTTNNYDFAITCVDIHLPEMVFALIIGSKYYQNSMYIFHYEQVSFACNLNEMEFKSLENFSRYYAKGIIDTNKTKEAKIKNDIFAAEQKDILDKVNTSYNYKILCATGRLEDYDVAWYAFFVSIFVLIDMNLFKSNNNNGIQRFTSNKVFDKNGKQIPDMINIY